MTSLGWSDPTFQRQRGGERKKDRRRKLVGEAGGFIDCHTKLGINEMEMEKKILTRAFVRLLFYLLMCYKGCLRHCIRKIEPPLNCIIILPWFVHWHLSLLQVPWGEKCNNSKRTSVQTLCLITNHASSYIYFIIFPR